MEMMDQAADSDLPSVLQGSSRRVPWGLALMVLLLGLCAAGAYFWRTVAEFVDTATAREVAPMPGLSSEDRAALSEIQSGQQKASDQIAELNRNFDAQRADLKRLSDQIAALTLRIDALQIPVPSASPPPVPPSPQAHAVSRLTKKLVRPAKPAGAVSVGGAPLILGPKTDEPR
ncbi:hypothetical protein AS156_06915 [Bradyrhizobium macuxiense]|uniref:Uncharacterized protein n=2 Tax=Bradyrhizobium macuxiense TaxID=1755647 RepID=A0A120FN38_9BRAD|nr:hypothetical protein AS156_06915 [Bradyrhizobium macuxiense]